MCNYNMVGHSIDAVSSLYIMQLCTALICKHWLHVYLNCISSTLNNLYCNSMINFECSDVRVHGSGFIIKLIIWVCRYTIKMSGYMTHSSILHFTSSAHFTWKSFPLKCFNFQQPYRIPTTSRAATTQATTPPRKKPAPIEVLADPSAVAGTPEEKVTYRDNSNTAQI